ncbi:MAG: hypothetical protein WCJ95_21585 [Mariniphaga sp.]
MRKRYIFSPIIILVIGTILFSYTATKSAVSSFTHDESYSYLHYVPHGFMDNISNKDGYSNNHILNTLCMKYSEKVFGSSEIALRLPNLLLLLVFLTYTFLLFRKSPEVFSISIFILMTANTALLDIFGLARGYGMSIGFMMMSLYHLIKSFDGNLNKHLTLFNIGALLAIFSNFTMLSFYFAALFAFNLILVMESRFKPKEKSNLIQVNKVNMGFFILFLIVLYEPVRKAIKFNSFDFGGKVGFVNDTVTSLISHLLTNISLSPIEIILLQIVILFVLLLPLILILSNICFSNKVFFSRHRALVLVNIIFLTLSAETVIQHYILKTDYLLGRFSIFLIPIFVLNFGFLLIYFAQFRIRIVIYPLMVALSFLSIFNFYKNTDLYSCAEWGYDRETKNVITALIQDRKSDTLKQDHIKLGINWLFEPTINFYRQTWHIDWLLPVDRKGLADDDDYEYDFISEIGKRGDSNSRVIFSSGIINTRLIRVK